MIQPCHVANSAYTQLLSENTIFRFGPSQPQADIHRVFRTYGISSRFRFHTRNNTYLVPCLVRTEVFRETQSVPLPGARHARDGSGSSNKKYELETGKPLFLFTRTDTNYSLA